MITIMRLLLVPAVVLAMLQLLWGWAFAGFLVAGISDGVDGFIARRWNQSSRLGAYLDPIADKLLLMTSYLFLAIPSYPARVKVPVWLAVLVLSRDFLLLLVALLLILTTGKKAFPPTWCGKVTTVTLIATVLIVLCANLWDWPRPAVLVAFGAAATMSVLSGFDYLFRVARDQPLATA
jgi:cardiolipin synthase